MCPIKKGHNLPRVSTVHGDQMCATKLRRFTNIVYHVVGMYTFIFTYMYMCCAPRICSVNRGRNDGNLHVCTRICTHTHTRRLSKMISLVDTIHKLVLGNTHGQDFGTHSILQLLVKRLKSLKLVAVSTNYPKVVVERGHPNGTDLDGNTSGFPMVSSVSLNPPSAAGTQRLPARLSCRGIRERRGTSNLP